MEFDEQPGSSVGRIRFAPEILARLGEELIPHADLGIVELVRNCYDAGAPSCSISLIDVDTPGGTIIVSDDGVGMTRAELDTGFLMIGRSMKARSPLTSNNRKKVGEKGLGRLAGLRLGYRVTVATRPLKEPGTEYKFMIDWNELDRAGSVDSIGLAIEADPTSEPSGTTLTMTNLRNRFDEADIERLVRSLFLINDPFGAKAGGFRVTLKAPGYEHLTDRLEHGYFDQADYTIEAKLDANGHASATVTDWRGEVTDTFEHTDLARRRDGQPFAAPPCRFTFWHIKLSSEAFRQRGATVAFPVVRAWLQQIGGVHLYHRGLRVHPYGDKGHDWLELNLLRTRSPEERPSTNNSIGRVVVEGDSDLLIQKTDRSGFIENEAFRELKAFGMAVLDRVATERVRRRDDNREKRRQKTVAAIEESRNEMEEVLEAISAPDSERERLNKVVAKLEDAVEQRAKLLQEDLNLYRTLGTVGTTAAVFAHESITPVGTVRTQAEVIESNGRALLSSEYEAHLGRSVERIRSAADVLMSSAMIPLGLVERTKRETRLLSANKAVADLLEVLAPRMTERKILLDQVLLAAPDELLSTVAAIEAIGANLVLNALRALSDVGGPAPGERKITVRTSNANGRVVIEVFDNGPGIRGISTDEIWLPGQTTRADGSGLGLTIVRDVVADLKGVATVTANGEDGGAHFVISIPTPSPAARRKLERMRSAGLDMQGRLL
ncbi:ATP-binding protein [Micromonospora aurantiaca]|uniref:ATP-binding protein n=1 Tax=Micromonospora aurantiaca (nom. illeg.) TaxID=47850 RepID=UPI0037AF326F